ncbi:MAG: GNAT family N-acetyltransferase [Actinobacteria bacterium]|jgi:ribosomal protein S18 acetylase RimI-like enzyme|nr:MAG: GNAT family N-acetyltransferase [Actinomycetota bacterium]
MNAIIREARPEDFEDVFVLVRELRDHFGDGHKPIDDEVVRETYRRFLDHEDQYIYVAEVEKGKVAGMLNMSIVDSLYENRPSAYIDLLIVNSGYRGKGLGRMLLDKAFARAVERDCCEIGVDTTNDNDGAIGFYRAYGFDHSNIMFEKELDAGGDA